MPGSDAQLSPKMGHTNKRERKKAASAGALLVASGIPHRIVRDMTLTYISRPRNVRGKPERQSISKRLDCY